MTKLLLILTMCLSTALAGPATAATDKDVRETIDEATTTLAAAGALGFAWINTENLINQAEKALADNRVDDAATLARQALTQAQNSIVQSEYADAHWQEMKPD